MTVVSSLRMNEEERRDQEKETDIEFLKIVVETAKMPSFSSSLCLCLCVHVCGTHVYACVCAMYIHPF